MGTRERGASRRVVIAGGENMEERGEFGGVSEGRREGNEDPCYHSSLLL